MNDQQFPSLLQIARAKASFLLNERDKIDAQIAAIDEQRQDLAQEHSALHNAYTALVNFIAWESTFEKWGKFHGTAQRPTGRQTATIEFITAPDGTRVAAFPVDSGFSEAEDGP